MCPRGEMYKEHVSTGALSMQAAFTDCQEQRQVSSWWNVARCSWQVSSWFGCLDMGYRMGFGNQMDNLAPLLIQPSQVGAGISMIHKLQEALTSGASVQRLAWVDAYGYDAWPAMAVLEAGAGGCHDR